MKKELKLQLVKKYAPWLLGIIYVISPIDIIPDVIAGLGWLDDVSLMGILTWWFFYIRPKREKSQATDKEERKEYNNKSQEKAKEKEETEKDPYKILGVKPSASKDEIKAAYNKLAAQYHPDKVQHLGDEFQDLAHEKFVSIQKAYETLSK